jgi:hypothetical protein
MSSVLVALLVVVPFLGRATPANKAAMEKHYDTFLDRSLARCTTCHQPTEHKNPESLEDIPHNVFGARLRTVRKELTNSGRKSDMASRLAFIAREDSDGDGVANETELLLGSQPGQAQSAPTPKQLGEAKSREAAFAKFLASYRWQPFEPVKRPPVPSFTEEQPWNPIDAFVAMEQQTRGLTPRPEASKAVLLRRVYLDLIGLAPTPEELAAFEKDTSPDAYEKVVERLLNDPRHGERWARHWMDVWRYSDWAGWSGGNQIRDSQPHIWRWRDWIVESVNTDKPYAQMLLEMLAGDEVAPLDTNTVRATGFLARNYKMLSREQWLEDTVKHTSMAFMGVTVGCAKCHDHMTDPVSQAEYYQMRAIFEPHWVRTDKLPGNTNTAELGVVRVFDTDTNSPTYFLNRGDERKADTNRVMEPGVPAVFGGQLEVRPIPLPRLAGLPDESEFVREDTKAASAQAVAKAGAAVESARTNQNAGKLRQAELKFALAQAQHDALLAVLETEPHRDTNSEVWRVTATNAVKRQRAVLVVEAQLKLAEAQTAETEAQKKLDETRKKSASATNAVQDGATQEKDGITKKQAASNQASKALAEAQKKTAEAQKAVASAQEKLRSPLDTAFTPRSMAMFPTNSTGRRLAFARWLANTNHPLTARVAVNHIWLRHFGRGLVETPHDFGRSGKAPSHPQLLDWLAAELMQPSARAAEPWSMKHIHRLIVTSRTYRMASTPDAASARIDPDNMYLWRMNSRRMEAEAVRDNLLHLAGELDKTMGGPEIDHLQGLKSKRRSLYLRQAAEKEVEFLKIFDGPSVTECYLRRPSVVPQQALALANNEMTRALAKKLAGKLSVRGDSDEAFARTAFVHVLSRPPKPDELKLCMNFLADSAPGSAERARENLLAVLFNHNEFVTVR